MNTTTQGKLLSELTYEVDVLHQTLETIWDDRTCICWQENGTLTLFLEEVGGHPAIYYSPSSWNVDDGEHREEYTTLNGIISMMWLWLSGDDKATLLIEPVWIAVPDPTREQFNALLGDIEIDL